MSFLYPGQPSTTELIQAFSKDWCKLAQAAKPIVVNSLAGRLYVSSSGWLLLSVPNALVRGAFDALDEPGAELPLKDGVLNAHISVMHKDEVAQLGGPDKISERGHSFRYTLGAVKTVVPKSWDGVGRVWYITVTSPELRDLRRSYGLSAQPNEDWDFHVTLAVRKKSVLRENEFSKVDREEAAETRTEGPETETRSLKAASYVGESLRGWINGPKQWNPQEGLVGNVLGQGQQVLDTFHKKVDQARAADRLATAFDPQHGLDRFEQDLQTGDSLLHNDLDRVLAQLRPYL